jgi:hypothetical protein
VGKHFEAANEFNVTLPVWESSIPDCRFSLLVSNAVSAETGKQRLQQRMDQLAERGSLELEGEVINSRIYLPEFYRQRDYQLAWPAHRDNILKRSENLNPAIMRNLADIGQAVHYIFC